MNQARGSGALHSAQAGRRGEKVRSDLHVTFEPATTGGIEVVVDSRVALYYGRAIHEQVEALVRLHGIEHGRLQITDAGALPFAIDARVRAALVRAGARPAPLGRARHPPDRVPKDRLRRSRLYIPGSDPKLMTNAGLYGADGIILDLEDSVHPDEKDAARWLVATALRDLDFGAAERMVRINQLPAGLDDLDVVLAVRPSLLLIPKVESAEQVREVSARVDACVADQGDEVDVWLMPILESARGIEAASEIAAASSRVAALTIGLEDYTADLGVAKTPGGEESAWARSRLVNAARAAGCQAIDSVYGDIADLEGLERWGRRSRAMGFEGMGCIHPSQVPVVHRAFAPEPREIERALRVVEAFEAARAAGRAVVALGSKMIDPPVVDRALALVARARRMGLLEDQREDGQG